MQGDLLTDARGELARLEARLAKLRRLRRGGVPALLKKIQKARTAVMRAEQNAGKVTVHSYRRVVRRAPEPMLELGVPA